MGNRFPSEVRYSVFFACSLLLCSSFVGVVRASGASDMYGIEVRWVMAIVEMASYVFIRKWLHELPWVIGESIGGCFTVLL